MKTIEQIIDETMVFILNGNTHILSLLREQYENSTIEKIEKSTVGCFVEFNVNCEIKKKLPQKAYIGDVFIVSDKLISEIGIILFIENRRISMLEFYSYEDDGFPDFFEDYKFVYQNGIRNLKTYLCV